LAAVAVNHQLLVRLKAFGSGVRDRIVAEGDVDQLLVWLTVDGLKLWQLFGIISHEDPLTAEIAAAIRVKTRPSPQPASGR